MTGGEDVSTTTDVSMRLIDEMSGLRGDIREIMTTMRHFDAKLDRVNDDLKENKIAATEAKTCADGADVKAQKALDESARLEGEIKELQSTAKEAEKEQRAQKRWLFATAVPIVALAIDFISPFFN